jgi:hypothetical protein
MKTSKIKIISVCNVDPFSINRDHNVTRTGALSYPIWIRTIWRIMSLLIHISQGLSKWDKHKMIRSLFATMWHNVVLYTIVTNGPPDSIFGVTLLHWRQHVRKVKLSLYQAVEAHRVVRRRGFHIFSRQSAHRWRWGGRPCVPVALYLQDDSWYSFLLEAESTPGP